jgi:hypothetical protein
MNNFWDGFEKQAGAASIGKKILGGIASPFKGGYHFIRNVGKAAENINKGTESAAEHLHNTVPKIEKVLGAKSDKALKYLKRGGLGALGIYGAGKAVSAPADIERYKYYHQQRRLSKKQLQRLDKLDRQDKYETRNETRKKIQSSYQNKI